MSNQTNGHRRAADVINTLNLGERLQSARGRALTYLVNNLLTMLPDDRPAEPESWLARTYRVLDNVGPAAASAATRHALALTRRESGSLSTNAVRSTDHLQIVRELDRLDADTRKLFTANLERTLIPNLQGVSFDALIDPKHMVDRECGYPPFITPAMYRYVYDRDAVGSRVNDIYADETWAVETEVYDVDDEDKVSPFEARWKELCDDTHLQLLQAMYRADKLSSVGRFGILFFGLDDGLDPVRPVRGIDPRTGERTADFKELTVRYVRPFDEYLVYVTRYESDFGSPRFGLPTEYNVTFVDVSVDSATSSVGNRTDYKVHWTRVVHLAPDLRSSPIFAVPSMQQTFNWILNLRRAYGASSSMLWLGGHPGLAFEMDPSLAADDVDFDTDAVKQEIADYAQGRQRFVRLFGGTVKTLPSSIADPEPHVRIQLGAIAMQKRVPLRTFLGSEEGKVAGEQDSLNWNKRLGHRLKTVNGPRVVRPVVDRLILFGALPPPKNNKYTVAWPDLNTPTNDNKANLALKWSQAMSQYVATGMIHLIKPVDFFVTVMGLSPRDGTRLAKEVDLKKLQEVDPDQGAGVNGVRKETASGGNTSGTSTAKRQVTGVTT